jgi:DNA-binding transcriptional MerR regulator|nr:MerR family DNA-binding transcriptional regulator [Acidiphilium rubrum]
MFIDTKTGNFVSKYPGLGMTVLTTESPAMAALHARHEREVADAGGTPRALYSVSQLARQLGVTARTIRFYEDKGLVNPSRAGTTRVYTPRDRARLMLILRGKRLGFSLREIKDYLDLYDIDPTQHTQVRQLLAAVRKRIAKLQEQRAALEQSLAELGDIERQSEIAIQKLQK